MAPKLQWFRPLTSLYFAILSGKLDRYRRFLVLENQSGYGVVF